VGLDGKYFGATESLRVQCWEVRKRKVLEYLSRASKPTAGDTVDDGLERLADIADYARRKKA
ncbi:unnamed protein product, partial [Amoebophrya sp. A120]